MLVAVSRAVFAALLTALLIVLVPGSKPNGRWDAPRVPTGVAGPGVGCLGPALWTTGSGDTGAMWAGSFFAVTIGTTPSPESGGMSIGAEGASLNTRGASSPSGETGPFPWEATDSDSGVDQEVTGSGAAIGVGATLSDSGSVGSGSTGVSGPYWPEGVGWGAGQTCPGAGVVSGVGSWAAGSDSTTSPLITTTANCCGAGAGVGGGSGEAGSGTGAGPRPDGAESTGDGDGCSSSRDASLRGTVLSPDPATSPLVITTFEYCCCGACSAGNSFARTSRPATKRETMAKTSDTTRSRAFRLRGPIRLVVVLCSCARGKSLGASRRLGGVPNPE